MGNWRNNLRVVEPYVPGEQPKQENMIKLNTNENPYPPAPGVEKVLKSMETGDFRLYPKPDARELVDSLAEEYGVPADQVFVGVGSDDVLGMAFLTCFNSERKFCFRILRIRSIRCGQIYLRFHTIVRHWTKISALKKRTILCQTEALSLQIRMHRLPLPCR